MRRWAGTALFAALLLGARALYDPVRLIESARLYGNIDSFAYYYVDLLIGTPPQRVSAIVDTGSSLCAFPCASCQHCGSHIDPAFHFDRSSTAKWLPCDQSCPGARCSQGHCSYHQGYTEGSSITGYWFSDKVRLGDAMQRNPMVEARMGCHQDEDNLFYTQKANGIMGISPTTGGRSTVLQELFRDREHVDSSVFALCFAEWGGRLVVGGYNETYHTGAIQWLTLSLSQGTYVVPLTELRLNGELITRGFGRTIVDSGTTRTYMKSAAYRNLRTHIETYCRSHADCGANNQGSCWTIRSGLEPGLFPDVEVVFELVSVMWSPLSYLYRKGGRGTWCYAFEDDGASAGTVLGATWMIHKEIIFDVPRSRMGVVQARCPEFRERPVHNADANLDPPTRAHTTVLRTTTSTSTDITTSTSAWMPTTIISTSANVTVVASSMRASLPASLPHDSTLSPVPLGTAVTTTTMSSATTLELLTMSPLSTAASTSALSTTPVIFASTVSSEVAGWPTSAAAQPEPASTTQLASTSTSTATEGSASASAAPPPEEPVSTSVAALTVTVSHAALGTAGTTTETSASGATQHSASDPDGSASAVQLENTTSAETQGSKAPTTSSPAADTVTEGLSTSFAVEARSSLAPESQPAPTEKAGPTTPASSITSSKEEKAVGKEEGANSTSTGSRQELVAAASTGAAAVTLFCFCACCLCRWLRSRRQHKHVKLKEIDDHGMPPQIVGSATGGLPGPETFVIGDDVDWEDCFEYIQDGNASPYSSAHGP